MKSTAQACRNYNHATSRNNIDHQELKKAIIGSLIFVLTLILTGLIEGM